MKIGNIHERALEKKILMNKIEDMEEERGGRVPWNVYIKKKKKKKYIYIYIFNSRLIPFDIYKYKSKKKKIIK